MKKKVSIIIPTYNVELYIEKCLNSLIRQTYKNIEIILVDDGSTDQSGKICDEYSKKDSRIKVIHKKNGGVSSARNMGLDVALGDFYCFVDPDDYVDNSFVEEMINNQTGEDSFTLCCFYRIEEGQIVNDVSDICNYTLSKQEYLKRLFLEDQLGGGVCWNKLFPKGLVDDTRFDTKISVGEDLKFVYEVTKKVTTVNVVTKKLYYSVLRDGSLSKTYKEKNLLKEKELCEKIMKDVIKNYKELMDYAVKRYLVSLSYLLIYSNPDNYRIDRNRGIKLLKNIFFLPEVSFEQKMYITVKILFPKFYKRLKEIKHN